MMPGPSRSSAVKNICGSGLPIRPCSAPGRVLERGHDRTRPRPHAVLDRECPVAPGREHVGAGEYRLRRVAQLGEIEVVVTGDHDHVRRGRRLGVVDDPHARLADMTEDRFEPDHVRARPWLALGEHVLDRRTDRHDLFDGRLYTARPQFADVLLRRAAGIVGQERDRLAGGA